MEMQASNENQRYVHIECKATALRRLSTNVVPTCSYNRVHGISPPHKSPAVRLNIKVEDKVSD